MSKLNLSYIQSSEKQKIKANLSARFLKNETGRLELALIIDENTTLSDLEKAWNSIKREANKILKIQGSDPNDYYQLSRLRLARLYLMEGFSYTEVAMDANYDTLVNLVQVVSHMNDGDVEQAMFIYQAIYYRLDGLGMKPAEIKKWIKESGEEVRQGRAPWSLEDGPVDKQRIVDLIRQLNREMEKGALIIKKPLSREQTSATGEKDIYNANKKYWDMAKQLLKQLFNSGGLTKLEAAHERYLKSLKG